MLIYFFYIIDIVGKYNWIGDGRISRIEIKGYKTE